MLELVRAVDEIEERTFVGFDVRLTWIPLSSLADGQFDCVDWHVQFENNECKQIWPRAELELHRVRLTSEA